MSAATRPVSVLIVDDDRQFRAIVRRIVAREPWIEVVGEAESYGEAEVLVRTRGCDVVLMDLSMPGLDGLAAMRRIKSARPGTHVIIVTVHGEAAYRQAALHGGADAFVLKKAVAHELLAAIRLMRRAAP